MNHKPLRLAATAAIIAVAATGCGSDGEPAAAPSPTTAQVKVGELCENVDASAVADDGTTLTCVYNGGKATWQAVTPSPTPSASPSPTVDLDAVLPFGKSVRSADGYVTSTVFAYRHNVARSAPRPEGQPGYVWGAADVKVCANKDITEPWVGVSNGPWALVYADDTQIGPSHTGYEAFPKPEYPWSEKRLTPGRCVRGWITFPVPGKTRPVFVEYAPEGVSDTPRWAVK